MQWPEVITNSYLIKYEGLNDCCPTSMTVHHKRGILNKSIYYRLVVVVWKTDLLAQTPIALLNTQHVTTFTSSVIQAVNTSLCSGEGVVGSHLFLPIYLQLMVDGAEMLPSVVQPLVRQSCSYKPH